MKKTWQERLIKESDKLEKKLDKLTIFIGGKKDSPFYKLNEAERDILVAQHSAMHVYRNILDIRLKREGLKDCIDDTTTSKGHKGFFESFNDFIEEELTPLEGKLNLDKFKKKKKPEESQEHIILGPSKTMEEMIEAMKNQSKKDNNARDPK